MKNQEKSRYRIYCDGACRGNPGDAAYGFVIYDEDGAMISEGKKKIGHATNNIAEYQGLIGALNEAVKLDLKNVVVHMDSQLIVRQMRGEYKIKQPKLKVLQKKARSLCERLEGCSFIDISREQNKVADKLANIALDF